MRSLCRGLGAAHRLDILESDFLAGHQALAQLTLALTGLVAIDVLLPGLGSLQKTGGRNPKPFHGGFVGFFLGFCFP